MDIVIFYESGTVENLDDVIAILDFTEVEERTLRIFQKGQRPFEVRTEDIAQVKIYGGDY